MITCEQLQTVKDGRWIELAGIVLVRQKPGSAKGVMFITLEDETNVANLVVWTNVFEKNRRTVLGASMMGARAFSAMKHVGLNVASDALMTLTVTGVEGGLVIAVADDVGMSSSQNEQDSRFWGRFAHIPVFEPADSQEAYDMTRAAYRLSEAFKVPVLLRLTTRICHVKGRVELSAAETHEPGGFTKDPRRWVMVCST